MEAQPTVTDFWTAFIAGLPVGGARPQTYTAWGFGDSAAMADELGMLVRNGRKTATCSLLWEYETEGELLPEAGDFSIILDGQGRPLCIIETTEVAIRPYNTVDAAFAAAEGEGDLSLDYWRQGHWRYFDRICRLIGREPALDMPLVCERFEVRYAGRGQEEA